MCKSEFSMSSTLKRHKNIEKVFTFCMFFTGFEMFSHVLKSIGQDFFKVQLRNVQTHIRDKSYICKIC